MDHKNIEAAKALVEGLQQELRSGLEEFFEEELEPVQWLRDGGKHGGGRRFSTARTRGLNRASINVSTIHYWDVPTKPLLAATALSTIIHPHNPHLPSMHMHISWTALRDGQGYWRLMADLNPSQPDREGARRFEEALRQVKPEVFDEAKAQGERYFYIPALGRHRGEAHYYLEGYKSGDFKTDLGFAKALGQQTIATYLELLARRLFTNPKPSPQSFERQLAYHTLYLFQVLTLDRGTTSGLLVHDQNDLGILASLPSYTDRRLLYSWKDKVPDPQQELVEAIVACLPEEVPTPVSAEARLKLAQIIREHYRRHPEALRLQARGNIIPPTVQNHRG